MLFSSFWSGRGSTKKGSVQDQHTALNTHHDFLTFLDISYLHLNPLTCDMGWLRKKAIFSTFHRSFTREVPHGMGRWFQDRIPLNEPPSWKQDEVQEEKPKEEAKASNFWYNVLISNKTSMYRCIEIWLYTFCYITMVKHAVFSIWICQKPVFWMGCFLSISHTCWFWVDVRQWTKGEGVSYRVQAAQVR